jgi:biotin carboxyl carrier protein
VPEVPEKEASQQKPRNDIPRTLNISLTLTSPEDLRVKSGETVQAGQVLSDRVSEKRSLQEKRELLEISLQEVSRPIPAPPEPLALPQMPELPSADFGTQEAAIKKAKLAVEEQAAVVRSQAEVIKSLGLAGVDGDAILHEQAKLTIAKLNQAQAEASLNSAIAALNSAKAARQYDEYRHRLEEQNRLLELQRQQISYQQSHSRYVEQVKDQEFRKASINTQIAAIDGKLEELVAVTAPFPGTIRRIDYEAQNNNFIVAAVVLDVADEPGLGEGNQFETSSTSNEPIRDQFKFVSNLSETTPGAATKLVRGRVRVDSRSSGREAATVSELIRRLCGVADRTSAGELRRVCGLTAAGGGWQAVNPEPKRQSMDGLVDDEPGVFGSERFRWRKETGYPVGIGPTRSRDGQT